MHVYNVEPRSRTTMADSWYRLITTVYNKYNITIFEYLAQYDYYNNHYYIQISVHMHLGWHKCYVSDGQFMIDGITKEA